jgi:hypothetical protein
MSSTRNTIEITNMESETNETLNEMMKIFFYVDWRVVLVVAWVLTSGLSIYETLNYCDQGLIYVLLSLVPFVNVILYFTIRRICSPKRMNQNSNTGQGQGPFRAMNRNNGVNVNRNIPRNGNGLKSTNVYPSPVYKN